MNTIKGFVKQQGDSTTEAMFLSAYCIQNDITLLKQSTIPEGYIPSGSVEWIEELLGREIIPDYYPEWLSSILYRKVWKSDKWILGRRLFVKPQSYKRFNGFITKGTYSKKKAPPYWYSEIVKFEQEWRYYITKGEVMYASWYDGIDNTTPDVPDFPVSIPKDYSGAIDLGILHDGKLALVEAQHPYACGWYGNYDSMHTYMQWLIDGWKYMNNKDINNAKLV